MHQAFLAPGQKVTYSVGAPGAGVPDLSDGLPGTNTTVILPGGVITAGAGQGGQQVGIPGAGGIASGLGVHRNGRPGAAGTAGSSGPSGTFSDVDASLSGGISGGGPGSGSHGATGGPSSFSGANGRVIIVLVKAS